MHPSTEKALELKIRKDEKHKNFRLNNLLESLQPIEKLLPTWK